MIAGVSVRPETDVDHGRIAEVVTRAFGSPAEARLVAAIRDSREYIAEMALVATHDNAVVGHVMISRCTLLDDVRERTIVMLSPLAVDPSVQGSGIGGLLIRTVTAIADERGEPLVVLEGNPRYYARFGFEAASGHDIEMPLPDWAPVEAAQVLRLTADDPGIRGRVVYPASFDVLGGGH